MAPFVGFLAATILALATASESQRQLLRDGSEIQRLVGDLHGRQRAQLGWTEEALQREYEVLVAAVTGGLTAAAQEGGEDLDVEAALRSLTRLIDRVRRVSLRALRASRTGTRALQG